MDTFVYPMCLICKLLTNISSTAPSSSFLSALSVASYCLYSLIVLANCRQISAICAPMLVLEGMTGPVHGFIGRINRTRLRVLYTAGRTVRNRRQRASSPKWDWTEVELALSWRCTSDIDSYPGWPMIRVMDEYRKASTVLSRELMLSMVPLAIS